MSSRLEPTIALVEHPQQRPLVVRRGHGAARRAVEAAPPELRLAVRAQIDAAAVALEHLDELEACVARPPPGTRAGSAPARPPRCGSRRTRRAACASACRPAGRTPASRTGARPRPTAPSRSTPVRRARVAEHDLHRPVDLGVAAAAALVGQVAVVADAGERQAVLDAIEPRRGSGGARRAGRSCRARRGSGRCAAAAARADASRASSRRRSPRGCRWRATGGRRRSRPAPPPRSSPSITQLGIGEVAGLERRVDHDLVLARLAARAAAGARGRSPRCARSRRSGRGSRPAARAACAAARAAPRAEASSRTGSL